MPPTTEIANTNGNGDQIKVGATGTISSLMSKELESIQHSTAQPSSSSVKKLQGPPVSVPCGYSPKRTQLRKNLPTDPSCSANSSSINYTRSGRDITQKPKPKPRMNEHSSPMLASSEPTLDKTTTKDKLDKKKKGHTHIVEVVDIKCNNPMSSRLKKLGFSKLSEPTV